MPPALLLLSIILCSCCVYSIYSYVIFMLHLLTSFSETIQTKPFSFIKINNKFALNSSGFHFLRNVKFIYIAAAFLTRWLKLAMISNQLGGRRKLRKYLRQAAAASRLQSLCCTNLTTIYCHWCSSNTKYMVRLLKKQVGAVQLHRAGSKFVYVYTQYTYITFAINWDWRMSWECIPHGVKNQYSSRLP